MKGELNGMGSDEFWNWFMNNAKAGWKIDVVQDGSEPDCNWACNIYDEKGGLVGSFDECDAFEEGAGY